MYLKVIDQILLFIDKLTKVRLMKINDDVRINNIAIKSTENSEFT
jgi:hypothetical protein